MRGVHRQEQRDDRPAGQTIALVLIFYAKPFRNSPLNGTVFNQNPAFPAYAFATAGGVDMHASLQSRTNNRIAVLYLNRRLVR